MYYLHIKLIALSPKLIFIRKEIKTPRKTNNNCSVKSFINKFNELKYMTDIPHTVSTGNKFVDKNIAKYGAKVISGLVKSPKGKIAVKVGEKAYPYIEKGGANIARAKAAYNEVCKRKK